MTNSGPISTSCSSGETQGWCSVSTLSSGSTTALPDQNVPPVGSVSRPVEQPDNPNIPLKRAPAQLDLFNCIPSHAATQRPRLVYKNSRRDSEDDESTLIFVRAKDHGLRRVHV
ncbi:hypothetical protein OPQ81_006710 [Rhizoctonia solani]|nr:hypothetical protein OPQ81_006710 [Rhizoctonia solani]